MDIVLVTHYWHFPYEKASSRYGSLARMLVESGARLEVITSDFYHATKTRRTVDSQYLDSLPYKVTLIHEPSYGKNISIARLTSHRTFARNALAHLTKREHPDAILCAVPSLDVADLVSQYAASHKIPIALDIQDLWPEAFRMVFDVPGLSSALFAAMKRKADRIYSRADSIIAVSQTYVERALSANKKCGQGSAVFLGVDLDQFDNHAADRHLAEVGDGEFKIVYIGTLGYSYDLATVIEAVSLASLRGLENVRLIVMGDGPLRAHHERHARSAGIRATFTGRVDYGRMVRLLVSCDLAVNPITKGAAASIINKHGDYFAAGLPILNTQESAEFRELLETNQAGLNCVNGDPADVAEKIAYLYSDRDARETMGRNGRAIAERWFDRSRTYVRIVEEMEVLAKIKDSVD